MGGMVDIVKHLKIRNGVASPCRTYLYRLRRRALLRFFIYSTICAWLFCLPAVMADTRFLLSSPPYVPQREKFENSRLFLPRSCFQEPSCGQTLFLANAGAPGRQWRFFPFAHGRKRVVIPLGAIQGLGGGSADGAFSVCGLSAVGGVCSAPAVGGSIPVSASALASSGV